MRLPVAPMIIYSNGSRDHKMVNTFFETEHILEKLFVRSQFTTNYHVKVSYKCVRIDFTFHASVWGDFILVLKVTHKSLVQNQISFSQ